MNSGRVMNLRVTIPAESRRMNVGKDVIRVLGSPAYICVLQRKDRKSIAITPCTAEHPMSFKVPDRLLTDGQCRMMINGIQFMENKTKIALKNKSIFITGVAGFIGSNLAKRLLSTVEGVKVVGLDNMNNYYDVRLKEARLKELEQFEKFSFVKGNLADKAVIESIFEQYKPEIVVNLGAQAGVRYSITNPDAYVEANLIGFYNILEACRHSYGEGHTPVEHLVYASSSSVYGSNKKVPYSTDDKVDNPVSLYAGGKGHNAAECLRSVRKSE